MERTVQVRYRNLFMFQMRENKYGTKKGLIHLW